MTIAVSLVIAYLLGGIPFGLLIPKLFGVEDIRRHGSGNIGATNVTRVLGFRKAIWVYVGDIAKGVVAVLVGRYLAGQFGVELLSLDALLMLCALVAVLGHLFPIFLRFKGGKGVNTALGSMLALLPLEATIAFVVFAGVVAVTRYVSLGSMAGALALLVAIIIERYAFARSIAEVYVWVAAVLLVLIVFAHRQNIVRLLAGTENRVTSRSRTKTEADSHA